MALISARPRSAEPATASTRPRASEASRIKSASSIGGTLRIVPPSGRTLASGLPGLISRTFAPTTPCVAILASASLRING